MARRQPRIKSENRGALQGVQFSAAQRQAIEQAYGHKIPSWSIVQIVTNRYVQDEENDRKGSPINSVRKKLKAVVLAATQLRGEFPDASRDPVHDGMQLDYELLYEKYFNAAVLNLDPNRGEYMLLAHTLDAVIAISLLAARELDEPSGQAQPDGFFWKLWVVSLASELARHGLPIGIRKDWDKSSGISPFVRLIKALQSALPSSLRRFTQSEVALSQAAYRALKELY